MGDLESNSIGVSGAGRLSEGAGRNVKRGWGSGEMFREESGQVLPWMVLLLGMFMGLCALTVDVGRGLLVRRQLQASADAASLAAALTLPSSTYATVGQSYSGGA